MIGYIIMAWILHEMQAPVVIWILWVVAMVIKLVGFGASLKE